MPLEATEELKTGKQKKDTRPRHILKKSIVTAVSKWIVAHRNKGLGTGRETPAAAWAGGQGQGQEESGSRDKRKMNTLAVCFENRTKRKGFPMNFLSNKGTKKKKNQRGIPVFVLFYLSS